MYIVSYGKSYTTILIHSLDKLEGIWHDCLHELNQHQAILKVIVEVTDLPAVLCLAQVLVDPVHEHLFLLLNPILSLDSGTMSTPATRCKDKRNSVETEKRECAEMYRLYTTCTISS